jgi:hypothetical protein
MVLGPYVTLVGFLGLLLAIASSCGPSRRWWSERRRRLV